MVRSLKMYACTRILRDQLLRDLGTPWMDSGLRPRPATNLPKHEGRTHMFYTGTPLWPFGFGLSYTNFSMEFADAQQGSAGAHEIPIEHLDTQFAQTIFTIKVTNIGAEVGKEVVQAYFSPPTSADCELKRQLWGFQGVLLAPGESRTLSFQLPAPEGLATVLENGDRVFFPGQYIVRFSRGHGAQLSKQVKVLPHANADVDATTPVMLSQFPSRWVLGHEVTVDACVEGTTDVISHTERFLVQYKQWEWVASKAQIRHKASSMCLTARSDDSVALSNCSATTSKWIFDASARTFKTAGRCLTTAAISTGMLRVSVTMSSECDTVSSTWSYDHASGFIKSLITNSTGVDTPYAAGRSPLCLALRSEGKFNTAS